MRHPAPSTRVDQQGAAALIVTMTLFFAMLLIAIFADRSLVLDQRSSLNQYRATQAFEAAEAGLEWAQAQLGSTTRIDAACRASSDSNAPTFRERFLRDLGADGQAGTTWTDGTTPMPLQPACVRTDGAWDCSCPASGPPTLVSPSGAGSHAAFAVEFLAGGRPGVVRVVARGCSNLAAACVPGATAAADAQARVEIALAHLPALAAPPHTALMTRGRVASSGALGVHNPDVASGGLALQAGGSVSTALLRATAPAGAPLWSAWVGNDASLAGIEPDALFAATFGLDKATWRRQAAVNMLTCDSRCSVALADAIAHSGGVPLIWVDGDLTIDGPIELGSAAHPIVLVASGALRLSGAIRMHGLLYGASLTWNDVVSPAAQLRGALVVEGDVTGDGAPDIVHDPSVLADVRKRGGSFARVSGSWRDF